MPKKTIKDLEAELDMLRESNEKLTESYNESQNVIIQQRVLLKQASDRLDGAIMVQVGVVTNLVGRNKK